MKHDKIEKQLDRIEEILKIQSIEPLSLEEASRYLNVSKSYLYKLTSTNEIPHYKPTGKKILFEKSELNSWILKSRKSSNEEINSKAEDIILNRHGKKKEEL